MYRKITFASILLLSACASQPEPQLDVRAMPPGTMREQVKKDVYECAKDATLMANSRTYKEYSWGPLITEKQPSKQVALLCLQAKGYEFEPRPAGEKYPRDPWTGERHAPRGW